MNKKLTTVLKETAFRTSMAFDRFRDECRGVAAIEFAFIAPLMLLMYVGTIELSAAVSVNRKLSRISSTIGDLITQQPNQCITNADLETMIEVTDEIMYPYSDVVEIVITGIDVKATGPVVDWSKGYDGGIAKTVGAPYPVPSQISGTVGFLIVANIKLNYSPAFGFAKLGGNRQFSKDTTAIPMEEELFLRPRIGEKIEVKASC